jgi:Ankyrin repeats (3 copies)/NACHT domain
VENAASVILMALWERCVSPSHKLPFANSSIAGCGKTILSSTIIDEINKEKLGVLVYYYFSFRDKRSQEVRLLLYSLLTQLVRGLVHEVPELPGRYYLPKAFRNLYDKYQPASEPTTEDLIATFQGISGESKEIYIVIDALDECPLQRDREDVIKFLKEFSLCAQTSTHILITSREEEDIKDTINEVLGEDCYRVSIQNKRVNDDIRVYLQASMAEDSVFKKWSPQVQDKVIEHLMEKANGVFRYVQCQLITLRECLRPKDIEEALNQLPKDLDETYSRMLSQIPERYVDTAYTILQWLAFSDRPLKLIEAAEVVVFTEGSSLGCERYPVSVDPTNRFDPQHIRAILSGLVTVSSLDERVNTSQDGVIAFAHFSVKEYLECNRVEPKRFRLLESAAHWFILKSCLAYIHRYDNQPSKESGSEQLPLLLYACKYWPHHAIALYRHEDQAVGRMAELLTIHKGPTLILSTRIALGLKNHQFQETLSPILRHLLKNLEGEKSFTELKFDVESNIALHSASKMGEKGLVKLLLDGGVNVNKKDYYSRTALHYAALHGHEAVVEQLLQTGADIEEKDKGGGTPLASAIENGYDVVIKLLLMKGAQVDYYYIPDVSDLHPDPSY